MQLRSRQLDDGRRHYSLESTKPFIATLYLKNLQNHLGSRRYVASVGAIHYRWSFERACYIATFVVTPIRGAVMENLDKQVIHRLRTLFRHPEIELVRFEDSTQAA